MLFLIICSFLVSVVSTLLVRRCFKSHAQAYSHFAQQRLHVGAVPRLGGLGILVGWWLGITLAIGIPALGFSNGIDLTVADYGLFVLPSVLVVAVGALEDVTQRVGVRWRLAATGVLGMVAVGWWGLSIPALGVSVVDSLWQSTPLLGMGLAVFAIMGLPHAFNIIDGHNGLAGSVATLVCLAIAHVALQLGDRELAMVVLCLAASTVGFLVWNYPRGLVFAGDGGAYLWGMVLAIVCISLVQRHPQVSPWFPVLLLIYPVWETFFSMYRKWGRGDSPGMADTMHLHQLVYRRVVKHVLEPDEAARLLARNNKTTPYLIAFTCLSVAPSALFWTNTLVLQLFVLLFVVSYVYAYVTIVRFRVPKWLRR